MNRRDFTKTTVGGALAMLLPSWLKFQQRRTIDLTPFCAKDNYGFARHKLDQPFVQDGMVYATDARICVRTTLADAPALAEPARLPAASALPWDSTEQVWKPWPKRFLVSDGESGACPVCDGEGGFGASKECRCAGDCCGCEQCFGSGYIWERKCDYCNGRSVTERPHMIAVGDVFVAGRFDSKIRTLGDLEFSYVTLVANQSHPIKAVAFRADGCEGMVMPTRS
jgi:hypothetical protein